MKRNQEKKDKNINAAFVGGTTWDTIKKSLNKGDLKVNKGVKKLGIGNRRRSTIYMGSAPTPSNDPMQPNITPPSPKNRRPRGSREEIKNLMNKLKSYYDDNGLMDEQKESDLYDLEQTIDGLTRKGLKVKDIIDGDVEEHASKIDTPAYKKFVTGDAYKKFLDDYKDLTKDQDEIVQVGTSNFRSRGGSGSLYTPTAADIELDKQEDEKLKALDNPSNSNFFSDLFKKFSNKTDQDPNKGLTDKAGKFKNLGKSKGLRKSKSTNDLSVQMSNSEEPQSIEDNEISKSADNTPRSRGRKRGSTNSPKYESPIERQRSLENQRSYNLQDPDRERQRRSLQGKSVGGTFWAKRKAESGSPSKLGSQTPENGEDLSKSFQNELVRQQNPPSPETKIDPKDYKGISQGAKTLYDVLQKLKAIKPPVVQNKTNTLGFPTVKDAVPFGKTSNTGKVEDKNRDKPIVTPYTQQTTAFLPPAPTTPEITYPIDKREVKKAAIQSAPLDTTATENKEPFIANPYASQDVLYLNQSSRKQNSVDPISNKTLIPDAPSVAPSLNPATPRRTNQEEGVNNDNPLVTPVSKETKALNPATPRRTNQTTPVPEREFPILTSNFLPPTPYTSDSYLNSLKREKTGDLTVSDFMKITDAGRKIESESDLRVGRNIEAPRVPIRKEDVKQTPKKDLSSINSFDELIGLGLQKLGGAYKKLLDVDKETRTKVLFDVRQRIAQREAQAKELEKQKAIQRGKDTSTANEYINRGFLIKDFKTGQTTKKMVGKSNQSPVTQEDIKKAELLGIKSDINMRRVDKANEPIAPRSTKNDDDYIDPPGIDSNIGKYEPPTETGGEGGRGGRKKKPNASFVDPPNDKSSKDDKFKGYNRRKLDSLYKYGPKGFELDLDDLSNAYDHPVTVERNEKLTPEQQEKYEKDRQRFKALLGNWHSQNPAIDPQTNSSIYNVNQNRRSRIEGDLPPVAPNEQNLSGVERDMALSDYNNSRNRFASEGLPRVNRINTTSLDILDNTPNAEAIVPREYSDFDSNPPPRELRVTDVTDEINPIELQRTSRLRSNQANIPDEARKIDLHRQTLYKATIPFRDLSAGYDLAGYDAMRQGINQTPPPTRRLAFDNNDREETQNAIPRIDAPIPNNRITAGQGSGSGSGNSNRIGAGGSGSGDSGQGGLGGSNPNNQAARDAIQNSEEALSSFVTPGVLDPNQQGSRGYTLRTAKRFEHGEIQNTSETGGEQIADTQTPQSPRANNVSQQSMTNPPATQSRRVRPWSDSFETPDDGQARRLARARKEAEERASQNQETSSTISNQRNPDIEQFRERMRKLTSANTEEPTQSNAPERADYKNKYGILARYGEPPLAASLPKPTYLNSVEKPATKNASTQTQPEVQTQQDSPPPTTTRSTAVGTEDYPQFNPKDAATAANVRKRRLGYGDEIYTGVGRKRSSLQGLPSKDTTSKQGEAPLSRRSSISDLSSTRNSGTLGKQLSQSLNTSSTSSTSPTDIAKTPSNEGKPYYTNVETLRLIKDGRKAIRKNSELQNALGYQKNGFNKFTVNKENMYGHMSQLEDKMKRGKASREDLSAYAYLRNLEMYHTKAQDLQPLENLESTKTRRMSRLEYEIRNQLPKYKTRLMANTEDEKYMRNPNQAMRDIQPDTTTRTSTRGQIKNNIDKLGSIANKPTKEKENYMVRTNDAEQGDYPSNSGINPKTGKIPTRNTVSRTPLNKKQNFRERMLAAGDYHKPEFTHSESNPISYRLPNERNSLRNVVYNSGRVRPK